MAAPTKFWMVIPTANEIVASNGTIKVQVITSETDARLLAVRAAIAAGVDRIIVETTEYAKAEIDPASATAQIADIV